MQVTSPLADALAAKADALRSVYNEGERLALFRNAVTNNKASFEVIGEVVDGWQKERRRFERGQEQPPAIIVYINDTWTSAVLETVVGFGVFIDEDAILLERCQPEGIARMGDEIAFRLRSTGRTAGTYPLAGDVSVYARATEDGEIRITEDGIERVLEAA